MPARQYAFSDLARQPFTEADDSLLAKFIAKYNPQTSGRQGNALYQKLTENRNKAWRWSSHHTWQSWRERYKNRQAWFDAEIARLHKKHGPALEGLSRNSSAGSHSQRASSSHDRHAGGETRAGTSKRKREDVGAGYDDRKRPKIKEEGGGEEEHMARAEEEEEETQEDMKPDITDHDPTSIEDSRPNSNDKITSDHKPKEEGHISPRSRPLQAQYPHPTSPTSSSHGSNARKELQTSSRIYPDITKAPSPFGTEGDSGIPGGFDPIIKDEPLTQEKLVHLSQLSHPSQEPTPPTSNADAPSSDIDAHQDHDVPDMEDIPEEFSQTKFGRKPVFPGGNYRFNRPVRTDTLVLESPPPEHKLNNAKHKRRKSSLDGDEDYFESLDSTPAPPTPRRHRETLQLKEGAFGREFIEGKIKPSRRGDGFRSDDDTEEDDEQEDEEEEDDQDEDDQEEKEVNLAVQVWPPERLSIGKRKLANADEDDEQHHHPFSQPTQPRTHVKVEEDDSAEGPWFRGAQHPSSKAEQRAQRRVSDAPGPKARMDLRAFVDNLPEPSSSRSRGVSRSRSVSRGSEQSNSEPRKVYVPSKELMAAVATVKHSHPFGPAHSTENKHDIHAAPFSFPQPHDRSVDSPNDPFLVPALPRAVLDLKGKQKMKFDALDYDKDRRKTFGGMDSRPIIPDIDLADRMNRPHRRIFSLPRQSLPGLSPSITPHHSLPSRRVSAPIGPASPSFSSPLNMSHSDAELAMRLGRAAIIQLISENRRFTEDTIMRVWQEEGSFELADARLKEMWEAAQAAFEASRKNRATGAPARHKPTARRRLPQPAGLIYTPLPAENGHLSDYSPPQVSRASQYRHGRRSVDMRGGDPISFSANGRQSSFTPTNSSPPLRSQSPEPPSSDGFKMQMRPVTPPAPRSVWGEEEERMLRSRDAATLQKLEARVGKMQYRRRMAEFFT
ncbi:hypothetical protein HWV62_18578 [Athelia sp. TMB]|nr:hypothetical protein HWV62_18578 [Athelia sp. TMB]